MRTLLIILYACVVCILSETKYDTMSKSKTTSTAGEPWSDAEVRVLLSIWRDQSVQDKLHKVV